jgi:hypothetical protein
MITKTLSSCYPLKHSVHCMYHMLQYLKKKKTSFSPHCICMFSIILRKTVVISLNRINMILCLSSGKSLLSWAQLIQLVPN